MIFFSVTALEYFQDPAVQEKVEEVGRIIYSNDSVTVNLSAVIAAGILALLGGFEQWTQLMMKTFLFSWSFPPLLPVLRTGLWILRLRRRLR